MILSHTVGLAIGGILMMSVFAAVFLYLRKLMPGRMRVTIIMSILCGAFTLGLLNMIFYRVYILDADLKVSRFFVCGSPECALGNGSAVKINRQAPVMIVNQSEVPLFVEEVEYGVYSSNQQESRGTLVREHSVGAAIRIDFLPGQVPPQQIQSRVSGEMRYWLRPATEEELSR